MSIQDHARRARRLIERLDQRDAGIGSDDLARFDWYAATCPCGLPPGECADHPRARASQAPPPGDWRTWLYMAGRGAGKTRAGAEWVRDRVESGKARRIALVAPTAADVRDTMIEGESGLMAVCPPWAKPKYEPSKRRLTWPNGAVATTFSAEEPERLRGPNFDLAWCDEVGSWERPRAFDMLILALRIGEDPRTVVTTTPRSTTLVKDLAKDPTVVMTRGSTYDNRRHLAAVFFDAITNRFEGTRLGDQEVRGELLEFTEGCWFPQFTRERHVSDAAEFDPALPVLAAIDCGVSRETGATFLQVRHDPSDPNRRVVQVFGDYHAKDLYSEANALAIRDRLRGLTAGKWFPEGRVDRVALDPAASARTGIGSAAATEYETVFGRRLVDHWPPHLVRDGLDLIDVLLGGEGKPPELIVHPRCSHLISAFGAYRRKQKGGEFLNEPEDPQHPAEDLMDALRGGLRQLFPEGRIPRGSAVRVRPINSVMGYA